MTRSQYKNIIQWTLFLYSEFSKKDSLTVIRVLLNKLGVAFPSGDLDNIISILKRNDYMGWRAIDISVAQAYADLGVPTMATDAEKVIIISPDNNIDNLSDIEELKNINCEFVKQLCDIDDKEKEKMLFWTYNYGQEIVKSK